MWGIHVTQPGCHDSAILPALCHMNSSLHTCAGPTERVLETRAIPTKSEASGVHLLLLLKKLHELVKSVSNLSRWLIEFFGQGGESLA